MSRMFAVTVDNETGATKEELFAKLEESGLDELVFIWLDGHGHVVVEGYEMRDVAEATLIVAGDDARLAFYALANAEVRG